MKPLFQNPKMNFFNPSLVFHKCFDRQHCVIKCYCTLLDSLGAKNLVKKLECLLLPTYVSRRTWAFKVFSTHFFNQLAGILRFNF